jgi:arylformamidase
MMKSVLLSFPIHNMTPQYGGARDISIRHRTSITHGDSSNSQFISMPNHVGTHIDFPKHFSVDGKTINDYPAEFWFFQHPFLLEYPAAEKEIIEFEKTTLDGIPSETDILLIKTGFQQFRGHKKYWNDNPGLAPSLARKLKTNCPELKAVGFDFISLSSYQNRKLGREAHREFLVQNDILIIEDMNLSELPEKVDQIVALPLLIEQIDGSPITVVANYE